VSSAVAALRAVFSASSALVTASSWVFWSRAAALVYVGSVVRL